MSLGSSPGSVILLSGPPGAGKTTLAARLGAGFERAVHLRTDRFFDAIVAGYIEPWLPESHAQNVACVTAAARCAATFAHAGYTVVVDGVILPWARDIYAAEFAAEGVGWRLAALLPSADTVVARGLARTYGRKATLGEATYREMHAQFSAAYAGAAVLLNTTELDEAQSLAALRALVDEHSA